MSVTVGIEKEEHFAQASQQRDASLLGMWIFLLTEMLMFSGMFVTALVLRIMHPHAVTAVALHIEYWIGALNTGVLIISGLIMSVAIEASRIGLKTTMVWAIRVTALFGCIYLALVCYEYYREWADHMMPFVGNGYALAGEPATRLFLGLYYLLVTLHAFHIMIGVTVLLVTAWMANRAGYLERHQNRIEVVGLLWHFIVLLWVAIFAIIYLLNR